MQILAGVGAPATGDYQSISTTTVGVAGVTTVTFSAIPATYSHLQIRYIARNSGVGDNFIALKWLFNSDSTAVYSNHYLYGNGAVTGSSALASTTSAGGAGLLGMIHDNAAGYTNMFGAGVIDILDYANTNKYKTSRLLGGEDLNGSGRVYLMSSNWQKTTAITQIDLSFETGNCMQYSQFALYGIK